MHALEYSYVIEYTGDYKLSSVGVIVEHGD